MEVMLEVAYFTPERIARTGQALALTSDARSRFERGVDPAFLDDGLAILTGLILDICGGEPSAELRVGQPPIDKRVIRFDFARTKALGGIDVPEQRQREILESLGFEVSDGEVTVPRGVTSKHPLISSRRLHGSTVTTRCPRSRLTARPALKPTATRSQLMERRVRRTAAARGLDEAVTWSFISEQEFDSSGGGEWTLLNPISEEMKVMRPSLLQALIAATRRNLDRGASSVRLFEVGRRYLGDAEHPTLGLILAGERLGRGWQSGRLKVSTRSTRKPKSSRCSTPLGLRSTICRSSPRRADLDPGRSATLRLGPKTIVAHSASFIPVFRRALMPSASVERKSTSTPSRRVVRADMRARPTRRQRSRDPRFRLHRPGRGDGRHSASSRGADKATITAARPSIASRRRTASPLRSKSRSSRPRKLHRRTDPAKSRSASSLPRRSSGSARISFRGR